MNPWELFPLIAGYECVNGQLRLYVDSPRPELSFTRCRGTRTPLFRLYSGADAEEIMRWLAHNRVWQCLRIPPPHSRERGIRAVLLASDWHCGEASALFRLARTRHIRDEAHREQLQREVRFLIESVLEHPVREGELEELHLIEDLVHVAPTDVELATITEIVEMFFGVRG